ncbi:MAG: lysophospholipid acyltransferase family protein [Candidatus Sumerlaeota bacterium]|nr:lysophospholipid acyltransferase family protein [Candidatus Sumerlaeota bacterium]
MSQDPSISSSRARRAFYRATQWFVMTLGRIYLRVTREGTIPRAVPGPVVFVSNHASNLDPALIGAFTPPILWSLAKKELFSRPILGRLIHWLYSMPIDRDGVDRAGLRNAVDVVRRGEPLLLFPEGTRTRDGTLGRGRAGAGMIAVMGKARILPLYVEGTGRAMPLGALLIRPCKVRIAYGEPGDLPERPAGMGNKDYYQACADEMMRRIAEVRQRVLKA